MEEQCQFSKFKEQYLRSRLLHEFGKVDQAVTSDPDLRLADPLLAKVLQHCWLLLSAVNSGAIDAISISL